jgi:hypothetical protein
MTQLANGTLGVLDAEENLDAELKKELLDLYEKAEEFEVQQMDAIDEDDDVQAKVATAADGFQSFFDAYLEAAFFTEDEELKEKSVSDFDDESLELLKKEARSFYDKHSDDFVGEETRAGHDFWLTRNGAGAGFWDGDWSEEVGKRLTDASKSFGEVNLYVGDDGKIY